MSFALLPYQQEALTDMLANYKTIMAAVKENKVNLQERVARMLLDLCCGGGKTVINGAFLRALMQYHRSRGEVRYFLVMLPNKGNLAAQLTESLKKSLPENNVIHLTSPAQLNDIGPWDVVVCGYESLINVYADNPRNRAAGLVGKFKSLLTREGEGKNLQGVWRSLAAQNVHPVLLIDEVQYGQAGQSRGIKNFMDEMRNVLGYYPVRIEASATHPTSKNVDGSLYEHETKVPRWKPVAAGVVRSKVLLDHDLAAQWRAIDTWKTTPEGMAALLNAGFDWTTHEELRAAHIMLTQWKILRHLAADIAVPYNPLMLVCVQNSSEGAREMALFERFFAEHGMTVENGKVARWLSDDKTANLAGITEHLSPVNVIIFKQAIAVGWDCPRAQLMTMTRKVAEDNNTWKSQLMGRLLRLPGACRSGIEALDYGYVYAPLDPGFKVPADMAGELETSLSVMTTAPQYDQLAAWERAGLCIRKNRRQDQDGGFKAEAATAAVHEGGREVTYLRPAPQGLTASVVTDGELAPHEEASYKLSEVSLSNDRAAKNLHEDIAEMANNTGGLNGKRVADRALKAMKKWALSSGQVLCSEHISNDNWALVLTANPAATATIIEAVVEAAKVVQRQNKDTYVDGKSMVFAPVASRQVTVATSGNISEPNLLGNKDLEATHLYGPVASPGDLYSMDSEEAFLRGPLAALAAAGRLVSWARNTPPVGGDNGDGGRTHASWTYPTSSAEGAKVGVMYPDYVALVKDDTGAVVPVMFEVKGEGGADGSSGETTVLKAQALHRYTEGEAIEPPFVEVRTEKGIETLFSDVSVKTAVPKGKALAAVVFREKNGPWVVSRGPRGQNFGEHSTTELDRWLAWHDITI